MLGLALDPCNLATLMGIGIRQDNIFVQAYLGIQPAVAMRWILRVLLLEQPDIACKVLLPFRWMGEMLLPCIETAPLDAHCLT